MVQIAAVYNSNKLDTSCIVTLQACGFVSSQKMEVEGKREQQLREYVLLNADRFFLSQDQVQELLKKFEYPNEIELLEDLVGTARTFARPHISNFFVGVAGLTNK